MRHLIYNKFRYKQATNNNIISKENRESYAKDVSVEAEPGDEKVKSEVDREGKMRSLWHGIVGKNGIHGYSFLFRRKVESVARRAQRSWHRKRNVENFQRNQLPPRDLVLPNFEGDRENVREKLLSCVTAESVGKKGREHGRREGKCEEQEWEVTTETETEMEKGLFVFFQKKKKISFIPSSAFFFLAHLPFFFEISLFRFGGTLSSTTRGKACSQLHYTLR